MTLRDRRVRLAAALVLSLVFVWSCRGGPVGHGASGGASPAAVAVRRSLPLLQQTMHTWSERRACVSCHHQALGTMALVVARERGFAIDEAEFVDQLGRMQDVRLAAGGLQGQGGINGTFGRGFMLMARGAAGAPATDAERALVHFLVGQARVADGGGMRWPSVSYRPPLEASDVTGTAVAIRAMQLYAPDARLAEVRRLVDGAAQWLERRVAQDAEERAMKLLGLAWAGAPADRIAAARDAILAAQRDDGGWAQLTSLDSDAYATGQALVALQQVGGVGVDDAAFRRGIAWLLERQYGDGSWRVATRRRWDGLEHFETGFPHGEDQFISTAATAWSVMALSVSIDGGASGVFAAGRPESGGDGGLALDELQRAVVFGSFDDMRAALDAGADPDAAAADGLRALHLAVHDPERVRLLLERGAHADAATARGLTPLMLAAAYGSDDAAADLLLERGADPKAFCEVLGVTPFVAAATAGKSGLIARLAAAGAHEPKPLVAGPALGIAACQGDCATLERLLDLGLPIDAVMPEAGTALQIAAGNGDAAMIRLLLARGAAVDSVDEDGMTALAWAARIDHGHDRALRALLDGGADPDVRTPDGRSVRDLALESGNRWALELLAVEGGR